MQSKATTVEQYLAELPADRRAALEAVRKIILKSVDRKKVEEGMQYGMIGFYVPHRVFPDGYHCDPKQPLPYIGLASQKNHMSLYMMAIYENSDDAHAFESAWAKTGKKLDMGKCCIRFKKLEDLALDVIADTIRKTPIEVYIARYVAIRDEPREARAKRREEAAAKKKAPAKPVRKKAAARKKSPPGK